MHACLLSELCQEGRGQVRCGAPDGGPFRKTPAHESSSVGPRAERNEGSFDCIGEGLRIRIRSVKVRVDAARSSETDPFPVEYRFRNSGVPVVSADKMHSRQLTAGIRIVFAVPDDSRRMKPENGSSVSFQF